MERRVKVFDTTLRDGEQAPGFSMNLGEKIEVARQLERLKVDIIEAGFAASSDEDFESVKTVAGVVKDSIVTSLCRAVKGDIDRSFEALGGAVAPRLHIFLATSDLHLQYKLKMTREQVLACACEMVAYAKSLCPDVQFTAEDATRSDRDFLLQVFNAAIDAGANTVSITDTVGYATTGEMGELTQFVAEHMHRPDEVTLAAHTHDDLGLAVANTLAAVRFGATQVECTIGGIGERAGNAALEEVVMGIATRPDIYGAATGIRTKQLYRSNRLLSTITGVPVPPTKAIVGRNAFAHEAGIHQHGVMADRRTYEVIQPETVGIPQNRMVLGKHSGRHAFATRMVELGHELTPEEIDQAFSKFKQLADRKKVVTDLDLDALIGEAQVNIPETYELVSFVVNTGSSISSTAAIKLRRNDKVIEKVAAAGGPIDACFTAIEKIVRKGCPLISYTIQAVTEGEDALGEVVVKLQKGEDTVTGRGLSTDIMEASIKAYVNAINKIAMEE